MKRLLCISRILNLPPEKNNECDLTDVREIQIILQQYRNGTTKLAIFPYKYI